LKHIVALAVLLLVPASAHAQRSYGCCGFRDWATYGASNPLRYHPTADFMGGAALDLIARGPWFAKSFRDRTWKRLTIVGLGAMAWQYQNLKEIPGYRWDYAAYDVGMTLLSAALVERILR
jgi:hypothetical protein